MRYRYTRRSASWSCGGGIGADDLLDAIASGLQEHGDVAEALADAVRQGVENADGERLAGLEELLAAVLAARDELLGASADFESPESNGDLAAGCGRGAGGSEQGGNGTTDAHGIPPAAGQTGRGSLQPVERAVVTSGTPFAGSHGTDLGTRESARALARDAAPTNSTPLRATVIGAGVQLADGEADDADVASWAEPSESGKASGHASPADRPQRLEDLARLEEELREAIRAGSAQHLDLELIKRLLGGDAAVAAGDLAALPRLLLTSGHLEPSDGAVRLTARGVRAIGMRALQEIFEHLRTGSVGDHPARVAGAGVDPADDTKPYEFGDRLLLDAQRTVMNAVSRMESGGIRLRAADFEVFRTEETTRAATVLLLDLSRSMPLRGCFESGRQVALALQALVRARYPRDRLYVVGFSDLARELAPQELFTLRLERSAKGTNVQQALRLARRLLGRHRAENRQIILITDGEPTAFHAHGTLHYAYPPSPQTFAETLREVSRCTRERISISTFMLDRSQQLVEFISELTRLNGGQAFFATPERLGEYVVLDYAARRRTV